MRPTSRRIAPPSKPKPQAAQTPALDLDLDLDAPPAEVAPADAAAAPRPPRSDQRTTMALSPVSAPPAPSDEGAIDATLNAMAKRTTVEDLARAGKKNLKTLSERQLKEWIREALAKVLATGSSSVSDADKDRMLAATRQELGQLMADAGQASHDREAIAAELAQVRTDRDTLSRERDALLVRLADMEQRLDNAAAQLADAEAIGAPPQAEGDIEEVESLRSELGQAYARLSTSENERANLQKTLGARLVATSGVAAALLELDRACYGGAHLQEAQAAAAGDEAAFYADEEAARATAEALARDLAELREALRARTSAQADDGLAGDLRRIAALPSGSAEPAADPAALAALRQERDLAVADRDEARRQLETAKRTVARLIAQADQQTSDAATARIARAEAESRQAAERLAQAEALLAAAERRAAEAQAQAETARTVPLERIAGLEAELSAARSELASARSARQAAAGRAETLSAEVVRLTRELAGVRATAAEAAAVTAERDRLAAALRGAEVKAAQAAAALAVQHERAAAAEAGQRLAELTVAELRAIPPSPAPANAPVGSESTGGRLAASDGLWRWAWRREGRLMLARFRGSWTPSEDLGIADAAGCGLFAVPGGALVAWRDRAGLGHLRTADGATHALGPVLGVPGLARGSGDFAPFAAYADPSGGVLAIDAAGRSEELAARLGAPPAAGAACAWWWRREASRHIAYRDAEGGINELLELDGTWFHASLTRHTGCPPAIGDPVGYAPGGCEHVLYRAVDGHIHQLCFDLDRWADHDLTAAAGCPAAAGDASGACIDGIHHVAFRGADGFLHLLRLVGDWRHIPLARLGPAAGNPIIAANGASGAIAWPTESGWSWARFAADPAMATAEALPG